MPGVGAPWVERRVLNYAHQGGAREAPSSTLYATRQALAAGATAVELDVHATLDRELVVCHDTTVDRTTNGTGAIAELTLDEVQSLDNAYWWSPGEVVSQEGPWPLRSRAPADEELGIPTLREVLEAFPGVILNLDIKQTAPEVEPYEGLLAELLRHYGRTDDVIVASFLDRATDAFAVLAPEIATSYGTSATAELYFAVREGTEPPFTRHAAVQVPADFQGTRIVSEAFVATVHRMGVAVHVWTIDDVEEMEQLVDLGVDGIITDRPSACASVLAARGVAYAP